MPNRLAVSGDHSGGVCEITFWTSEEPAMKQNGYRDHAGECNDIFFQACISEDHQKNFVNNFCASLASAWRAYSQTIVLFKCEIVCGQDFQAPVVWLHTIAVYFAYRNSEVSTCFSIYSYGRQACHSDHKRGGTACYPHTPVRP